MAKRPSDAGFVLIIIVPGLLFALYLSIFGWTAEENGSGVDYKDYATKP